MAFIIKRNDRRPYLTAQFFQADGTTPLNLTGASDVNIAVRPKNASENDEPKFKTACIVTDVNLGKVEYRWEASDTDTPGSFDYEFEITWSTGITQTIPADSYFTLTVVDDVG